MAELKADRAIRELGVGVPGKPKDGEYHEYQFPSNVTSLQIDELGMLMSKLTAWYSYTLCELGQYEGNLIALKDFFETGIMQYAEDKMPNKLIEYKAIEADEKIKKAKQGISDLKSIVARMQRLCDAYKASIDLCSRELSRRQLEFNLTR